jgi:hypothetical protein
MIRTTMVAFAVALAPSAYADEMQLPPLQLQGSPQAVVDEHIAALNVCDWNRLMAQYPEDAEIHLPGGTVVAGRAEIGALFQGFCKPVAEGGLMGLTFSAERSFLVGGTLNVQWIAEADFLAEPYRGSDAYVTRDGLMAAMVSTFDGAELKMK